jgi:hypothetical protein
MEDRGKAPGYTVVAGAIPDLFLHQAEIISD